MDEEEQVVTLLISLTPSYLTLVLELEAKRDEMTNTESCPKSPIQSRTEKRRL